MTQQFHSWAYKYLEKNLVRKDTCTPTFTAALHTTVKTEKQPKCPLTDQWIKKMWDRQTTEHSPLNRMT